MHNTTHKRTSTFIAAFRDHPASVGESYFGHMGFALRFSGKLFAAGLCALVHAVFPPLFETTASERIKEMSDGLSARGARD